MPESLIACPCALWPALVVSLGAMRVVRARMQRLARTPDISPPPTQLRLQRAWSRSAARALIRKWDRNGCERVREQIRLDFGLIVAYAIAGAASAMLAGQAFPASWAQVAALAPTVAILWGMAALLDVGENVTLLWVLPPASRPGLQPVAFGFAVFKWVLVIVGLAYLIAALPFGGVHLLWRLAELF